MGCRQSNFLLDHVCGIGEDKVFNFESLDFKKVLNFMSRNLQESSVIKQIFSFYPVEVSTVNLAVDLILQKIQNIYLIIYLKIHS